MKKTYAHILAAKEFCPNPDNKPEVNHLDGNTKNNYCGCKKYNYQDTNLEWVTRKENMEHASKNGLINHESLLRKYQCKKNREKINYDAIKRPIYQLDLKGNILQEYESVASAAKQLNVGGTSIGAVARKEGYHKTAHGFNWVFKDEYDPRKNYIIKIDQSSGAKKEVLQINLDGEIIGEYSSIKEASIANGFPLSNYIGDVCNGRRKTYKGYVWRFKSA